MATAKDVMTTDFHTLSPDISISEAVMKFKIASEEEQKTGAWSACFPCMIFFCSFVPSIFISGG